MRGKKENPHFNWKRVIFGIMIIAFLIWFFWPINYTFFSFEINETGEKIDGEVFFDNTSIGFTNKGEIKVFELDYIPSTIIFEAHYEGEAFEFLYEFPEDYFEWGEVPFEVSQERLDYLLLEKRIQKEDQFSNISELHWGHIPLTYKFGNECIERLVNLSKLAFEKIELETNHLVSFEETLENPDISIFCKERIYEREGEDTLANAVYDINDYNENLITHGKINIYGQGMICLTGYPDLEVHEILHLFGFVHNPLTKSIMHPYSEQSSGDCKITKIDDEYVSCLKYIYSNGEEGECNIQNYFHENPLDFGCSEGWYPTIDYEYCCPEPNMEIIDGYCD